jgi:hypothetical protein
MLLTSNTKIDKSVELSPEIEAVIMQMNPGKGICKNYKLCIAKCIAFTGYGKFKSVQAGRQKRKDLFLKNPEQFKKDLYRELCNLQKRAAKKNKQAACRLNGFTDIDFSKPENHINGMPVFDLFQDIQFWDYTADSDKVYNNSFQNYHLTFSYKSDGKGQNNAYDCLQILNNRVCNIAVIDTIPDYEKLMFLKVKNHINGDNTDFRWMDAGQAVIWLKEKS